MCNESSFLYSKLYNCDDINVQFYETMDIIERVTTFYLPIADKCLSMLPLADKILEVEFPHNISHERSSPHGVGNLAW